jgi:hypothetical protein
MPGMCLQDETRHGHERSGIAGRHGVSASPDLTASIASHMLLLPRPWRSAWLGLASMVTNTSVWRISERSFSKFGWRSSSGAMRFGHRTAET